MTQNKGSNVLIQQLLKAEEEADLVIKKAKDVRAKMLKEAETTATEELKIFRAKEKERLNKGHKEKSTAEDEAVTKIEQNTKEEIKKYKELFKKNKDQIVYKSLFNTSNKRGLPICDQFWYNPNPLSKLVKVDVKRGNTYVTHVTQSYVQTMLQMLLSDASWM
ncbi:vacuolar ATP synthase subunit G [Plasmodium ovale curtisi]|uniref:Vacuolar ATP synthase subunit G n=1 Tax=Plasmodium ovale curtisi TaxID=864141 RepID=A0A1A8WUB4_PLAOA|nr:vacuolar ATP synthase subunit G [Plasmodium ovale curtisi]SBS96554.1 vacuolar ATP synthase subunit G [Plasmodium ovale curtisi]